MSNLFPWCGHYVDDGGFHEMQLRLAISIEKKTIRGVGSDEIGEFIIRGRLGTNNSA